MDILKRLISRSKKIKNGYIVIVVENGKPSKLETFPVKK